ncbi:MAG: hypothetical protein V1790_13285 [Planctomycetota bacterium]
MAREISKILETAEAGLTQQTLELSEARARQLLAVTAKAATGSGNIDATLSLDRRFRLVFVRCHFAGGTGTAAFTISVDSTRGSAYDAKLFTITQAGVNKDVNLRIGGNDAVDPSAWTFQPGDKVWIKWTNPDSGNMTWGLEAGLALAS